MHLQLPLRAVAQDGNDDQQVDGKDRQRHEQPKPPGAVRVKRIVRR